MTRWRSFAEMRGDSEPRDRMRWSELLAALGKPRPAECAIRRAIHSSGAPRPRKRYGHYCYRTEHLEAARACVAACRAVHLEAT